MVAMTVRIQLKSKAGTVGFTLLLACMLLLLLSLRGDPNQSLLPSTVSLNAKTQSSELLASSRSTTRGDVITDETHHTTITETNVISTAEEPLDPITATQLRAPMADIAAAFEAQMQFPPYAKPLKGTDWALLNPRAYEPLTVPMEGTADTTVQLIVPHYIVDITEDLPVTVISRTVSSAESSGAQAEARLSAVTLLIKRAQRAARHMIGEKAQDYFQGVVPASVLAAVGAGEVLLVADLTYSSGKKFSTAARIRTYHSSATLRRVGTPHVEGAHLIVPLEFQVHQPGLYRVRANLFEVEQERPVSHLSGLMNLTETLTTGTLKVHASTLRSKMAPGPYRLQDINITQVPQSPGEKTGYGSTDRTAYDVPGFALDR